jgi:neutral ceramidase
MTHRLWLLRLSSLALSWVLCACHAHPMPRVGSDLSQLVRKAESQAGVAQVDITPPPGLGMFGHGPEARIAEGALLRLRCHAFVFVGAESEAAAQPEALAFVPCELAAPSLLLQREVAARVRAAGVPLGAERIWIAATHTHAAPAHYFVSDSYSGPTSGRRIGFDREVLDFLAQRIARAVCDAYHGLKPARWAWAKQDVLGLGKNRAYPAFVQNRSLPAKLAQQISEKHEDVTQSAVDAQLSLLRIEQRPTAEADFEPAAALVVFGLHPTVIDHSTPFYGGDAFGYAERALTRALENAHRVPVMVAFANGIEGDVTPVRSDATVGEAQRIGAALAARVLDLWQREDESGSSKLDAHAPVRSAYRDLDFSGARVWRAGHLCALPEFGAPGAGGADDHPTFLRAFEPFNPGVHARTSRACQGPKYPVQNLGEARAGKSFPRFAPVSAAILGNGLLIALPAEPTTVTGMRIRDTAQAFSASWADAPQVTAVVGLTNEYLQYVASADEYALQRYEGASTLYGPQTAEFLREQSECLVRYLGDARAGPCNDQAAQINQLVAVGYRPSIEIGWWQRLETQRGEIVLALSRPEAGEAADGTPQLTSTLRGIYPGDVKDPDLFAVQVELDEQVVDDTQGTRFLVRWDDVARDWRLTWRPDETTMSRACGGALRFRVRAAGHEATSDETPLVCRALAERAPP